MCLLGLYVFCGTGIVLELELCAAIPWNGVIGNVFAIQCGVRQGGILSPMLFSIYIYIYG